VLPCAGAAESLHTYIHTTTLPHNVCCTWHMAHVCGVATYIYVTVVLSIVISSYFVLCYSRLNPNKGQPKPAKTPELCLFLFVYNMYRALKYIITLFVLRFTYMLPELSKPKHVPELCRFFFLGNSCDPFCYFFWGGGTHIHARVRVRFRRDV